VIYDSRTERVEFISNRHRVNQDPSIKHVEIMDKRFRVIYDSRIQHEEFISNRYRVIHEGGSIFLKLKVSVISRQKAI